MFSAAAPAGPGRCPSAPIASRWPRPSGRKNAYRGLAACRRAASGKPCSQALTASGKIRRLPTTARRSHLLPQSDSPQGDTSQSDPTATLPITETLPTSIVTATVANDDSGLIDVASIGNFEVQMNTSSYFHIFAFHVWFPIPGKSRYAAQYGNVNALNTILSKTLNSTMGFPEGNGNYYFSSDLGFIVGTDQAGLPTSMNTVIVQPVLTPSATTPGVGVVVTMYPGQ